MEVSLTIAAVGVVAGAVAAWLTADRRTETDPTDPHARETVADALAENPQTAQAVARRSRRAVGGSTLTIGFAAIFILVLVAGLMFDMVDQDVGFARWDLAVAEWGAANAGPARATLLDALTTLGGTPFITLVTLAIGAWGWWRWKNPSIPLFMTAVSIGQAVVNNGIKWIVLRDRPDLSQLADFSGTSFPSGHSAAAAATYAGVALVLSIGKPRTVRAWLAGGAALVATVVAATRALLGVHWLTDVIAGVAVGWAWFTVCAIAFGGRLMHFGELRDEVAARSGHIGRGSAV